MLKGMSADAVRLMNDYTFEEYNNARETRAWYEKFLREHNGKDWRQKLEFSISDLVTGNLPKAPNGETVKIFWYRIKYRGVLVGYADAKIQPIFNGRKIISDMWIIPEFRKRGHFHVSFAALVAHIDAVGVCIMMPKYRLYGGWFELFGFDWMSAFGSHPSDDPEDMLVFLTTRDAYKDFARFMIKYVDDHPYPSSERGRVAYEEVRKELEAEASHGTR